MNVLIISGGDFPSKKTMEEELDWADYIICADHGFDLCREMKILPNILIGDLDSVSGKNLEGMKEEFEILKLPSEKDETDTEVALDFGLGKNPKEIHIVGGFGTRKDHVLGNFFLLEKYKDSPCQIVLLDDRNRVIFLKEGKHSIEKRGFHYVSILPVSECFSYSTEGFQYEVEKLKLKRGTPRGISNELKKDIGTIIVHEGMSFCIQSID
ncbi:thiamine diphosphokinase [Peptoniphilus sp. KCTC 25270]|uniref:thiamine diphosphokinase n=1 Tax=Peptoniphilus sp. KCTC 25270 TaxID=2897414 RepID=UPI001E4D420D|nr:thiamine diphosphokinase [Peptoniphilus sp. KCTC 25270]MCD1147107.1 thiamine diphosphokinase [Peptoniphilus sp. KCTC 25270]